MTLQRVRSLMIPPGIPDFATRVRLVGAGEVTLRGRAWAGRLEIVSVEVSTDGGDNWSQADLEEPVGRFAWRGWQYSWQARAGRHMLCVRSRDSAGNVQPFDQPWTYLGMGNNMAQRVEVIVE